MRTIRSSAEIDVLFREGSRIPHPLLLVLARESQDTRGRVAFVAGRKLGNAVARNRARRVMRGACRRAGGPWAGKDVVLVARTRTGSAPAGDLDGALAAAVAVLTSGREAG